MPLYNFINNETGEQFTEMMSMAERKSFLSKNPKITQQLLSLNMISGTGIRNDDGWKENLSRIAEAHPNSSLAEKVGSRSSSKEVKVRNALDKHGMRKGKYSMNL